MLEVVTHVVKHLSGSCGEPHISILHILPFIMGYVYIIKHKINWCYNRGCEYCKKLVNEKSK